MRAYWTIIRDAFHAALASKVLYVMLGIIVLCLLVIAPIGYREILDYQVNGGDINDPRRIAHRLLETEAAQEPSLLKDLWSRVDTAGQNQIRSVVSQLDGDAESNDPFAESRREDRLRSLINQTFQNWIKQEGLVDPKQLDLEDASDELKQLAAETGLGEEKLWRFNRLALEQVFPVELRRSGDTLLKFGYFGFEPMDELMVTHAIWRYFTVSWIPYLLDKFVLSFGVLVAILFTSSMIPELLEPGSLNLLLSKPLRRSGLLLARFVGACSFTLVNGLVMFIGLWLILGIRLGLWNPAFLACIPVYVFVFAIYYSVSALIGLMTRSAILSVVSSILFWLFCFLMGLTHDSMSFFVTVAEPSQITKTVDRWMMLDDTRRVFVLEQGGTLWQQAFLPAEASEVPSFARGFVTPFVAAGPVRVPGQDRFAIISPGIADGPRGLSGNKLYLASASNDWLGVPLSNTPAYATELFVIDEEHLGILTLFGEFYRVSVKDLDQATLESTRRAAETEQEEAEAGGMGTQAIELGSNDDPNLARATEEELPFEGDENSSDTPSIFVNVSPITPLPSGAVATRAYDETSKRFSFFHEGTLLIATWNGERFELESGKQFDLQRDEAPQRMAIGGNLVYLAYDRELLVIDWQAQTVRKQVWNGNSVRDIVAEPSGAGAVVVDIADRLWQVQSDATITRVSARGNGLIKRVALDDQATIWTMDRYCGVQRIDLQSGRSSDFEQLPNGFTVWLYRYVVQPIYVVTPKPGEFYKMVTALVASLDQGADTSEDSREAAQQSRVDRRLESETAKGVWNPLITGIVFIGIMLGFSTLIFARLDM